MHKFKNIRFNMKEESERELFEFAQSINFAALVKEALRKAIESGSHELIIK